MSRSRVSLLFFVIAGCGTEFPAVGPLDEGLSETASEPLRVVATEPNPDEADVALDAPITVMLSAAPDQATLSIESFRLLDSLGEPVAGAFSIEAEEIHFAPHEELQAP